MAMQVMREMRDSQPIYDLPIEWLIVIKALKEDREFLTTLDRSHEFAGYENMA